jgi:uncharacterized lipoprotein
MSLMLKIAKFSMVSTVVVGLVACSYVPEVNEVFPDRKDEYKKSHEIPSLEVPPELSSVPVKNEYDGAVRSTRPVTERTAVKEPVTDTAARTYPLNDSISEVELIEDEEFEYMLVRDSMRNTWRRVLTSFDELGYVVEDINRQQSVIYLEITKEVEEEGILQSLSFWKSDVESAIYVINLERIREGVLIHVLNENNEPVNDEVSTQIYDDLIAQLTQ